MRASGIYRIVHIATGREYIGQSQNIAHRWYRHRQRLNNGEHHAKHLLAAWRKYGDSGFRFDVLELCQVDRLNEAEQRWLDDRRPVFNTARVAGSTRGVVPSPETRSRISKAGLGRTQSEETRRKRSETLKGRSFTPEHRAALTGRIKSDDEIERMRSKLIGRKLSPEHREKARSALIGRPVGEQQRAKMRAALTGIKRSPESIERMRAAAQLRERRKREKRDDSL